MVHPTHSVCSVAMLQVDSMWAPPGGITFPTLGPPAFCQYGSCDTASSLILISLSVTSAWHQATTVSLHSTTFYIPLAEWTHSDTSTPSLDSNPGLAPSSSPQCTCFLFLSQFPDLKCPLPTDAAWPTVYFQCFLFFMLNFQHLQLNYFNVLNI